MKLSKVHIGDGILQKKSPIWSTHKGAFGSHLTNRDYTGIYGLSIFLFFLVQIEPNRKHKCLLQACAATTMFFERAFFLVAA